MPDIDPKVREEIEGSMVDFWQRVSRQIDERNQNVPDRPTPKIEIDCAVLQGKDIPRSRPATIEPEQEKTEVFLAQEIDINANGTYDYGPPDVPGAEIGRVLIIADEVNVAIQITADGNPVLFGGSDTITASNEIKEVTADEGQFVTDDISFTFTFSPVTGAVASIQVYGLIE